MLPVDLESGALHALGVACRDDHLGSLVVGPPGGLQADAGTTADHQERLTGELRVASDHATARPVAVASSATDPAPHAELGRCRHLPRCSAAGHEISVRPRCGVAPGELPGRRRPACSMVTGGSVATRYTGGIGGSESDETPRAPGRVPGPRSARAWTRSPVRAGCWCCAAKPASARARLLAYVSPAG